MIRIHPIRKTLRQAGTIDCRRAQALMSSFIDLMASPDEVQRLEEHVSGCTPCQRQLQAYISVKNLMACAEEPAVPEDLVLQTRVRLSHERNPTSHARLQAYLANTIRPLAVPMLAGISVTVLFFGILLSTLVTPSVIASDSVPRARISFYKQVRTTDPTMSRFAGSSPNLQQPLTVETHVDEKGRVVNYVILSGPDDPEIERWLRNMLYFAQFNPATLFGRPVSSRVVLSFLGATG